jgi:glycosyltransferase involved in cell wall biosynthesis
MGFFYSPVLARRLRERLARERFDLIFVHCSSVAQYVSGVRDVPKILDFGDMDSQKWLEYSHYKPFPLSLGYWLEGKKLVREEKRLAGRFDLCTATTRAEWETLESYGTGSATDWFPNGVDSTYFSPSAEAYDPDTICFVGRMDYYPNQECMFDFCSRVLPSVRARRPDAKLLIVGADPSPAVNKLGELPGVTVTGSVPDVHPEQDPGGHGGRSARRHQPRRGGRGRCGFGRAFPGRERPGGLRARGAADSRSTRTASPAECGRARAHAFAPRMAAFHAAAGPHHRPLSDGVARRTR